MTEQVRGPDPRTHKWAWPTAAPDIDVRPPPEVQAPLRRGADFFVSDALLDLLTITAAFALGALAIDLCEAAHKGGWDAVCVGAGAALSLRTLVGVLVRAFRE